jgi:aspartate aminotransferase-like enzyme
MTSRTVARGKAQVLLCPGPVMLSPGVKAALAQCEIGHRDARFSELVARLRRNCGLDLGATKGTVSSSSPARRRRPSRRRACRFSRRTRR